MEAVRAQRDDQKTHPGDDEEVGDKSDGREAVEMESHQRRGAQDGHSGDEKGEPQIFQDILLPRGFQKKG